MAADPTRHWLPEWAPQGAVLLSWPNADTDWAENLTDVEAVYCSLTAAIARFQAVHILCKTSARRDEIKQQLRDQGADLGRLSFSVLPYNDTWIRDYGPLCVQTAGRIELVDFRFDGWGRQYPSDQDDLVTQRLHRDGAFLEYSLSIQDAVIEGGSIETDGAGTLLTTERCLITHSRNPALGPEGWQQLFIRVLAATVLHAGKC